METALLPLNKGRLEGQVRGGWFVRSQRLMVLIAFGDEPDSERVAQAIVDVQTFDRKEDPDRSKSSVWRAAGVVLA